MVNILFAFDEQDQNIGSFNQGCKEDFEEFLLNVGYSATYISSNTLNSANIQLKMSALPACIFLAYSHGEGHRLFAGQGDYVSTIENISLFKNALFYTVSCNTGSELGHALIANGCQCYFGYKTSFNSWLGYKDFSDCANWGFVKFLQGEKSKSTYDLMIEKYNSHIDNLREKDYFVASLLRENRDGLVMLGEDISINDFDFN